MMQWWAVTGILLEERVVPAGRTSLLGGAPVRVLRSIPAVPLVTSMVSPAIVSVSRDVAMITVEPVRVTHDVAFVNLAAAHVPLVVAETYGPYVARVEVEPEEARHVG